MTQRINKLPPLIANQIAAGEIIERPASIIKELLENSLDAGASLIDIKLRDAGCRQIVITDNGSGIHPDDMLLAIEQHATSKVKLVSDLDAINSLGFRGEALASIQSAAKLQITSRINQQQPDWQLVTYPGKTQPDLQIAAHPIGTTITVNELFYNLPARRKFLRLPTIEKKHSEQVIRSLALSNFAVGFNYYANQKLLLKLPAITDLAQHANRVAKLLGNKFLTNSSYLDSAASQISLHGWLGWPDHARSQVDQQYFFINGRYVRDRLLMHAIRQAYQPHLPVGRHPSYVLYLTINPEELNVNVHPAKHEVRFRQQRWVHDFLVSRISKKLIKINSVENNLTANYNFNRLIGQQPVNLKINLADDLTNQPASPQLNNKLTYSTKINFGQIIGFLEQKYLFTQHQTQLLVINVELAYAGLVSLKLLQNYQASKILVQKLLIPYEFNLADEQKACVIKHNKLLCELGIVIKQSSNRHNNWSLTSIVNQLQHADYSKLINSLVDYLLTIKFDIDADSLYRKLARHAYYRIKNNFTLTEQNSLLAELNSLNNQQLVYQGQLVYRKISSEDLDIWFQTDE